MTQPNKNSYKQIPFVPNKHWFFKNSGQFANDVIDFMAECQKTHGDFCYIDLLINDINLVSSAEMAKYILQDNNKNYRKSLAYRISLKLMLGNGLLTSEGDFWRKQRRMAQPAFHRKKLAGFVDLMVNSSNQLIDRWRQNADSGRTFNIMPEMTSITAEVVAKALFSSDVSSLIGEINSAVSILNEFGMQRIKTLVRWPLWIPNKHNRTFKKHRNFLNKLILSIIEKRRNSNKTHNDLLGMLMDVYDEETGEKMNDKQLLDECLTLFIAGNETSAMALTWAVWLLLQNPNAKQKIREEVNQVVGNERIGLEHVPQLSYTLAVINESMRMFPPAWLMGRETLAPDVINGYKVPAKRNVLISIYNIHYHKNYWDEPELFKPERFNKENMKAKPKYAFMPFGGGPRLCIGNNFALMEMQVILASLVRAFDFETETKSIEMEPLITLRPKGGLSIKVKNVI